MVRRARVYRSIAEKRRIVELTLHPEASVARVAQAEGVNSHQVFVWRRAYLKGRLGAMGHKPSALLPVVLSTTEASAVSADAATAAKAAAEVAAMQSLSPRVRGNRIVRFLYHHCRGSIPAGAGDPSSARSRITCERVYPRGCGGTLGAETLQRGCVGLSPRVRGNQGEKRLARHIAGSIPAGAGEPLSRCMERGYAWVYPRGCGGTPQGQTCRLIAVGLSPRVRGNPDSNFSASHSKGSIPAGAGEPQRTGSR